MLSGYQNTGRDETESDETQSSTREYNKKLEEFRAEVRECELELAERKNEYFSLRRRMDRVRRRFYEGRRTVLQTDDDIHSSEPERATGSRTSRGERVTIDDSATESTERPVRRFRPYVLRLVNGVALMVPARSRSSRVPRYYIFERITRRELFMYERANLVVAEPTTHRAYFENGRMYVQCSRNTTRRYQVHSYNELHRSRRLRHQRRHSELVSSMDDSEARDEDSD